LCGWFYNNKINKHNCKTQKHFNASCNQKKLAKQLLIFTSCGVVTTPENNITEYNKKQ
jgi:hypothetical protein